MKQPKLVECKSTGCHLPEEAAREVDSLVPTLPQECRTPRRKSVSEKGQTDPTERTDVSYISTPAVDHDREIVVPDGMDLSVYERNKIVLFQHDQGQPCGKCLWVKPDANGILAKTYYPARPDKYEGDDWLPERVWGLVQADILRGKSVTFLPLEMSDPDDEQKSKGAEVVFPKSLLLEYSVVAVPCCPDALVQAIEKGCDLGLMGIQKTGQRVQVKRKRVEVIDRTAEFVRAVEQLRIDPDDIAARVLDALKNRGRI